MEKNEYLHSVTPLIYSHKLTQVLGRGPVYLKLDNLQPSGSFKIRGMGRTCQAAKESGATKLVGSSGGNAGMAMAHAAKMIQMPLVLFIPTSTPEMMINKLQDEGADVRVVGANWNEANAEALNYLENEPGSFFVHPFDQESSWEGHSTIVTEIKDQLKSISGDDRKPAAIVSCVGGGGLAIGILMGLEREGWSKVPLVLMETHGADCFNQAITSGQLVTLPSITSVAKSLGALTVSERLFELATSPEKEPFVISRVVKDREAVDACIKFADDHRMLVEPACGAALSAIYGGHLTSVDDDSPVVVVVCGGNLVSVELLHSWKMDFEL